MADWRSIDSAPRCKKPSDFFGERFLGWNGDCISVWHHDYEKDIFIRSEDLWEDDCDLPYSIQPTHWMPLPEPPNG